METVECSAYNPKLFMLRLILIFIVGVFVAVGVLAVALYHFFGVRGLIAFPFVILALMWVAKWMVKGLVKKFALSLFGIKARALRGATMNVHSIKAVPKPPEPVCEPEDDEDEDENESEDENTDRPAIGSSVANPPSLGVGAATEDPPSLELGRTGEHEKSAETKELPAAVKSLGGEDPKDYVELDVTITPKADAANRVWEPSELILTSEKITNLTDLEKKSVGAAHTVEIWDGSAFGPDENDKYPGEQRLKIVFEVKPGTKSGWLCYYHEAIGQLELPVGTVEV